MMWLYTTLSTKKGEEGDGRREGGDRRENRRDRIRDEGRKDNEFKVRN